MSNEIFFILGFLSLMFKKKLEIWEEDELSNYMED